MYPYALQGVSKDLGYRRAEPTLSLVISMVKPRADLKACEREFWITTDLVGNECTGYVVSKPEAAPLRDV
jgi:hypothetical protein